MITTDEDLARLAAARHTLSPGEILEVATPTFSGSLSRHWLRLRPSGTPLPPALAAVHPWLAELAASAALPPPRLPLPAVLARLATCRACPLWEEPASRCASVRCPCARRYLWHPQDRCPERRWS